MSDLVVFPSPDPFPPRFISLLPCGVFASRLLSPVPCPHSENSDVVLDAEDRAIFNRGAILDVEGQALLTRLRAIGSPVGNASRADAAAPRNGDYASDERSSSDGANGSGDYGWGALETGVRRAIDLRCSRGRRGYYAEELSDALRALEQARCPNAAEDYSTVLVPFYN